MDQAQIDAMETAKLSGWEFEDAETTLAVCPVCGFSYDASHFTTEGLYICPACAEQRAAQALHDHMRDVHGEELHNEVLARKAEDLAHEDLGQPS